MAVTRKEGLRQSLRSRRQSAAFPRPAGLSNAPANAIMPRCALTPRRAPRPFFPPLRPVCRRAVCSARFRPTPLESSLYAPVSARVLSRSRQGGELTPLRGATLGTVLAGHAGLFLYRARAGFEYATWLALALLFIGAGYLLWGRPGLGLGLGCAFALHHGLCAWAFQLRYALLLLRGTPGEAARQIGGVFARRPCRPASGHV